MRALIGLSLLANALVIAAILVFVISSSAQTWVRDLVDAASIDDVTMGTDAARRTADDAREDARRAAELAEQGPTEADVAEAISRASSAELRLSSVQRRLADLEASASAACDWARLQQTNGAGTSLENVFFDYVQTVC